jgi:hypothetical protein
MPMMSSDNPNEATLGRMRLPGDAKPGSPIAPRAADPLGVPHSVPNGADYAPVTMKAGDDFNAPGPGIGGRSGDDSDAAAEISASRSGRAPTSASIPRGRSTPPASGYTTPGGSSAQRSQGAKGGNPTGNAAPGFSAPVRGPGQYGGGGGSRRSR